MRFGSLFAGIGGMDLGLERAGMECAWQVEIDDYATRVLEKHWSNVRRWRDVTTFPPDAEREGLPFREGERNNDAAERAAVERVYCEWRCDLICGGFPCQPVSSAGKQRGEDDERWLWDEMRRVCAILRPTWVLAENVPGLLSARDVQGKRGALFGRVLRDLAALGYRIRWDCVPAAAVGAPHIRDRVFIVGYAQHDGRHEADGRTATLEPPRSPESNTERQLAGASSISADVADTDGTRQPLGSDTRSDSPRRTTATRTAEGRTVQADYRSVQGDAWWSTEPNVGRVAHGVPSRVDRLRCLGNAVVPAVAEWIGRRIKEAGTEPAAATEMDP